MINFEALETACKTWFKGVLSLNAQGYLASEDGRRAIINPTLKAKGFYSLTSTTQNGQAHRKTTVSGVTGNLIPEVSTIEHVTVTFKVESYSQLPNQTAIYYASRLRSRLDLPNVGAAFKAAGFALCFVRPTVNLPLIVDDRVFSCCAFEVVFAVMNTEAVADAADEQGTIESIEYSGTITAEETTPILIPTTLVET